MESSRQKITTFYPVASSISLDLQVTLNLQYLVSLIGSITASISLYFCKGKTSFSNGIKLSQNFEDS